MIFSVNGNEIAPTSSNKVGTQRIPVLVSLKIVPILYILLLTIPLVPNAYKYRPTKVDGAFFFSVI